MRLFLPIIQRLFLLSYTLRNKTQRLRKSVCLLDSSRPVVCHWRATTCGPQHRENLHASEYTRLNPAQTQAEVLQTPGWPPQDGPLARRPAAQLATAQAGTTPKQQKQRWKGGVS